MSSSNIFTRRCLWFYSIFVVVVAVCDCWNVTPCISNCSSIQRMWRRERERERERATKKMLENYYHVTHSLFIYFPSARQLWERKECANIKNNRKQVNVIANRFLVCSCVCVRWRRWCRATKTLLSAATTAQLFPCKHRQQKQKHSQWK